MDCGVKHTEHEGCQDHAEHEESIEQAQQAEHSRSGML